MNVVTMGKHHIYEPLDTEIEPLIVAMRQYDWLDTVSSCFGHDDHEIHNKWTVSFWCRKDKLDDLCQLLSDVEVYYEPMALIDLSIVYSDTVQASQLDAGPDWVSLDLSHDESDIFSYAERLELTQVLTEALLKYAD